MSSSPLVIPASARSWIATDPESHFPLQNLPFGRIEHGRVDRLVSRIGDTLIDLSALAEANLLPLNPSPNLDLDLEMRGSDILRRVRAALYELLRDDNSRLRDDQTLRSEALLDAGSHAPVLPLRPRAFVDFYSGIHHASNVGRMFRPDQPPLLPNYRWLPIGYNGRASTVVVSGTDIVRPKGQTKGPNDPAPAFGPTKELDFELEMGFFVSKGTAIGETVSMAEAEDHILGMTIVNDWSARDVQRFEYQPLGPFLAKSFGTSISPWLVLLDALEPFRITGQTQDPEPLPHLAPTKPGHYDIHLEVLLKTERTQKAQTICRSNTKNLYWSMAQQLVHQASNGTALEPGDLYASGTISGEEPDSFGSLLELSWRGERPITIEETGETRTFLLDGDEVTVTAYAQGDGFRVGFGEVSGRVLPAS